MKKTVKNCEKMTKKRPSGIVGVFSLFQGIPVFLKILFLGNKPNFLNPRITTTTCKRGTYNDFHPQTNKKSKPNPNPIKANFKHPKTLTFSRRTRKFREPFIEEQTQFQPLKYHRNLLCYSGLRHFPDKTPKRSKPKQTQFARI